MSSVSMNCMHTACEIYVITHQILSLSQQLMFGTSVLLVLWLPCALLQRLWPGFLPYNLSLPRCVNCTVLMVCYSINPL